MAIEIVKRNITRINRELELGHQVTLGSTSKTKTRLSEFFSSKFKSTKYKDHSELQSLTVVGSDYFVLRGRVSYIDTDGKERYNEESLFISYPHLTSLKRLLNEVKDWLESEDYADMFVQWEGATVLNDKYFKLKSGVSLALDKSLVAYPIVLNDRDIYYEAVGFTMDDKIDVFLTYDELCLLLELFNTINLYESSLQLISLKNIYSSSQSNYYNKKAEKYEKSKEKVSNISKLRSRVKTNTEDVQLDLD